MTYSINVLQTDYCSFPLSVLVACVQQNENALSLTASTVIILQKIAKNIGRTMSRA
jgi:hypothetical protein